MLTKGFHDYDGLADSLGVKFSKYDPVQTASNTLSGVTSVVFIEQTRCATVNSPFGHM
jgi:hypothetical protein